MKRRLGRIPTHGTVVAYMALFVALGGTAYAAATIGADDIQTNAVRSRHINAGAVSPSDIRANAVTGSKVLDGSLELTDLPIAVIQVSITTPALNAGQCEFAIATATGVQTGHGVLAYTGSGWDNRLMIAGIESSGADEVTVRICNHTTNTNLNAGTDKPIVVLRF